MSELTAYAVWYVCGLLAVFIIVVRGYYEHQNAVGAVLFNLLVVSLGPLALTLVLLSLWQEKRGH